MSENIYNVGDSVKVKAEFRDPETKKLVDPSVVVCTVRPPETKPADVLTPAVTKTAVGKYEASIEVDRAGRWWVAFDGAGLHPSAEERSFVVRKQQVPR